MGSQSNGSQHRISTLQHHPAQRRWDNPLIGESFQCTFLAVGDGYDPLPGSFFAILGFQVVFKDTESDGRFRSRSGL